MKTPRLPVRKRALVVLSVVAVVCASAIQKVLYLSAGPGGPKDCPPLSPDAGTPLPPPAEGAYGTLAWAQKGGTVDDISCLDRTAVYGVVDVRTEEDVRKAVLYAKERGLKVSVAGAKHSMGGQAFARSAVVLDMRNFNGIEVHADRSTVTVKSGATWHGIQNVLHPRFAVKAMQSTDVFTVGGSISVNAHGMDHRAGSVGGTVRFMRVMTADGSVRTLSRTEDPGLFNLVVGGYGLFGVILDAELDIVPNDVYESGREILDYAAFPERFEQAILPDESLGLFYGHLSTAPQSFLREMILYSYRRADPQGAVIPELTDVGTVKLRRFFINLSKSGNLAMRLKWFMEKRLEPLIESCTVTRNQAMKDGEGCLVSRNEPMHDSVPYLMNGLKNDTDILQEYFIPRASFVEFVDGMRAILRENGSGLLNASVRVVHAETNFLSYAPKDAFAVVLYVNQTTDAGGNARMAKTTRELIDLTSKVGGRFFLPYQLHYTPAQLEASYPEIRAFFAAKKRFDPSGMFTNTWYETYGKDAI